MKLSLILLILPIFACGHGIEWQKHKITTPNGKVGMVLLCRQAIECWEEAGESCRYGYTIIDYGRHGLTMVVECKQKEEE